MDPLRSLPRGIMRCRTLARRIASVSLLSSFLALALFAGAVPGAAADEADVAGSFLAPARDLTAAAKPSWSPGGEGLLFHPRIGIPIVEMPIEDVDLVEVASTNPTYPNMWAYPVQGGVYFGDDVPPIGPPVLIGFNPTVTPGISGVDFVADPSGAWGAYQTLATGYIYDLAAGGGAPITTAIVPVAGAVPMRYDIDPFFIPYPVTGATPFGIAVVFVSGNTLHARGVPGGAFLWDNVLPTPMVTAVDPAYSNGKIWAPSEGFMRVIAPVTGATLSTTPLGSTLIREVDVRFSSIAPAGPVAWLPTATSLWYFDDTPAGTGAPLPGSPIFLGTPGIEGNDMEIDPTGTYGFLPRLAFMFQVSLGGPGIAATWPFAGFVHQRNQDAVFTPMGVPFPAKAVYCVQGAAFVYDIFALTPPAILPSPGVLWDGVDPSFTDTAPFGGVVNVATTASVNVFDVSPAFPAVLAFIPYSPGAGVLRTDADPKPAPVVGNFVMQPAIGGIMAVGGGGFGPDDWVVTLSNGIQVVDMAALVAVEFLPYTSVPGPILSYRGGDAQPTFLNGGPPEPAFSVDNPDQDFVTKCWEYKYAMNRWPYWWSLTSATYYPHWVPFGVFGPPALTAYDIHNDWKLCMLDGSQVVVLDTYGNPIHFIPLPARPISGLIWDWDNKICKVRLQGRLEAIINLASGFPVVNFVTLTEWCQWYPVVDRMNGWQCLVSRGGYHVWIYNNLDPFAAPITLTLSSRVIRPPVFDDQRKTMVLALANRRAAFINLHNLRMGLPVAQYLYYSPVLPGHFADSPVLDIYNYHAICQLTPSRLVLLNCLNGNIYWDSGPLAHWPISRLHVDCYNKIAKGYYRNAAQFFEYAVNLYPVASGGLPVMNILAFGGSRPYGYPWFDSKDGYEFVQFPTLNQIRYINLFTFASGSVPTPLPMIGALFVDRINKYGLVVLSTPGPPQVFWMDLHKVTSGIVGPSAFHAISLPFPAGVRVEQDIVFTTQLHTATLHLNNGQIAHIDMVNGQYITPMGPVPTMPRLTRQLYTHPFRGLVNYPYYDLAYPGPQWGEVTVDMNPVRWNPAQDPTVMVAGTPSPPLDAVDLIAPAPPTATLQIAAQPGDAAGLVNYELQGLEPGTIGQFTNQTQLNTLNMNQPVENTADGDGVLVATLPGNPGDVVCFTLFDMPGNAAPVQCVNVITKDVGDGLPAEFAFALAGDNPVRDEVGFRFALPARADVSIGLFDVAGRRIATIAERSFDAGVHTVSWSVRGSVRPGVYFARITAGADKATAKMIVID